jgi:DNA topoisomerase-2
VKKTDVTKRKAQDFFDKEYLGYAKYVVENRAIPSLVDGFKPSQRKIAYASHKLWKTGKEKPMKVFQLGGQAAAISFFHHGSLDGTIIGMTQNFKNSMPIFQGVGQFGSLRSPEPGAARYIGVKFNENFRLLYKDFELTTSKYEEGQEIEPSFFLPIVPTVLLNGGSGIAVGFATNILNRSPTEIIDACLKCLNGRKIGRLVPWVKDFHGTVTPVPDTPRSWIFHGEAEVKNTTTVIVKEIPPSWTYEKYEAHLDKLEEKGTITSYDDESSDRVRYVVKFTRAALKEIIAKKKLISILKLQERQTENITTLDENGTLKIFECAEDLLPYFVNHRLLFYEKRKLFLLAKISRELFLINNRVKFIKAIISKKLEIRNKKRFDIEIEIAKLGIEKIDRSYRYLLDMPVHSLTKEKWEELQKKMSSMEKEREKIENTESKDFYKKDLKDLRKKVIEDVA